MKTHQTDLLYVVIAIAILLLFIVFIPPVRGQVSVDRIAVAVLQNTYYQQNNKYKQTKSDGVYEIREYQSDFGFGYQIVEFANGLTRSIGYGPEAKSRTWDWSDSIIPQ